MCPWSTATIPSQVRAKNCVRIVIRCGGSFVCLIMSDVTAVPKSEESRPISTIEGADERGKIGWRVMGANSSGLPRIVRWMILSLTVVIVISVVAGVAATVVGGSLTRLGDGFGGLYGAPALLLTFIALIVGVPATIIVTKRLGPDERHLRAGVVVLVGAWVVGVGYAQVAHIIDPCANGWWDARSRVGSQPLCERFGSELNWHTRFHLVAHALPAAVLLAAYVWAVHKWVGPHVATIPPNED